MNKKYSLFIGRWQPLHDGHRWLFNQRLNRGYNVLIAIRDVKPDENNPFTPTEVHENLTKEFYDLIQEGRVKIIIIDDIESINYGRGVGYKIYEHQPPKDIHDISATKIRKEMGL
jgi:nicotinamide mononucleotide adenylyltransferase